MKTVYFVRHGESVFNAKHLHQDATPALTPKGEEQAKTIAERVSVLPIDVIVSSTMVRARQTADAILQKVSKPIVYSDLFVENRNPSVVVGKSHQDPFVIEVSKVIRENFEKETFKHSDEESPAEFRERGKKALAFLDARKEENILVVTHGTFLKVLVAHVIFQDGFTGSEWRHLHNAFRTSNTGITQFYYDETESHPQWRILIWNDHSHLGDVLE